MCHVIEAKFEMANLQSNESSHTIALGSQICPNSSFDLAMGCPQKNTSSKTLLFRMNLFFLDTNPNPDPDPTTLLISFTSSPKDTRHSEEQSPAYV